MRPWSWTTSLALATLLWMPAAARAEATPSAPAPATQPAAAPLSAEKRALIDQLMEITGGRKLYEQTMAVTLEQARMSLPQILQGMTGTQTTPSQQSAFETQSQQIFDKLAARMMAAVTFDELMSEVYYPLYDKYFTVEDLQDIIAFYQTPTGQRLIQSQPQLMREATERSTALMTPRLIEIMQETLQEELRQPGNGN